MSARYVQHISGQGEKWEINEQAAGRDYWYALLPNGSRFDLPKSEYSLCPLLEQWGDVTEHCIAGDGLSIALDDLPHIGVYRLRKVLLYQFANLRTSEQWAFIVERRQP